MTSEAANAPYRRARRWTRRGVGPVAVAVSVLIAAVLALATAYLLTAPRLAGGPVSSEGSPLPTADAGRHVLFEGADAEAVSAHRRDLAREVAGALVPVAIHDRAVRTVMLPAGGELRLVPDPAAERPLGDGAVVKVYRDGERYAAALIGTRERIVGPDLRLVPAYGPEQGGLSADGLPLTRLLPEGMSVTLVVVRLALDGPAPDGPVYLDVEPPATGIAGDGRR